MFYKQFRNFYRLVWKFFPPLFFEMFVNIIIYAKNNRFTVGDGIKIELKSKMIPMSLKRNVYTARHEKEETEFIRTYLPEGFYGNVLEIGAGIGLTSCIIGKRLAPGSRHLIVEPYPEFIALTKHNLELNRLNAEIIRKAVSYKSDKAVFFINENISGSSIYYGEKDTENHLTAEGASLRDILKSHNFVPDFTVIDAEGVESEIIEKDVDLLEKCRTLVIEFHPETVGIEKQKTIMRSILNHSFNYIEHKGNVFVFGKN